MVVGPVFGLVGSWAALPYLPPPGECGLLHAWCREVRDPRFESLSGKYSEDKFKKCYAFLYDEKLPQEKKELKEAIGKASRGGGW